jgi:hypothetical protein
MTFIYHMVCIICQSLKNSVTILSIYVVGKKLISMTPKNNNRVFIDRNHKLKICFLETINDKTKPDMISHCFGMLVSVVLNT